MTSGEIAEAVTQARGPELSAIDSAINDYRIVGITGPAESGKSKLLAHAVALRELDDSSAVVRVNLDGVYSPRHLSRRWLRAVAKGIAGPIAFSHIVAMPSQDLWPGATRRVDHDIRNILHDDYEIAVGSRTDRQRSKGGNEETARALLATERLAEIKPTLVLIDHLESPALSGALDVRELLWQLRATSQRTPTLRIVLVCRPGAVELAAGEDAAFYGDGIWLTIGRPALDAWRLATGEADDVEQVYGLTQGHFWATLLTLERAWREPGRGAGHAFAELAREHVPLADRCLEHAGTLHRLGPAILQGVATGGGPYEAVSDALSRDIATAARRLEMGGLVHHPKRGEWKVVNPFVAEALRSGSDPLAEAEVRPDRSTAPPTPRR